MAVLSSPMSTEIHTTSATLLPAERRDVAAIALIAMLRMFGLFALLPVLAIYAADLHGATPVLIGLAVGGYGLTQALLQIPFGALSDRIGRRPVIVLGLSIFAFGSIVAGYSDSIYGVIGGRFLQGAGAVSATLAALLADVTRPQVRTRSMAVFGIGIGGAFLLALILGPVIAAMTGVRSLFWTAAAAAVIATMVLFVMPARSGTVEPTASASRPRLRSALLPELLRLDSCVFALHAMMTAMFVALPFMLQNTLELPLGDHWKIYIAALAASLAGTIPLILADERRGKTAVFSYAIALMLAGLLALAFLTSSTTSVFLSLAVFFAGFNFLEAGLPARLSIQAPEDIRGAAMGVFSSSQFLGAFAGGLLGGLLLESHSGDRIFVACAAVAGLWLLAQLMYRRP